MNDGTADPTLELTNSVKRRLAEGDLLGPAPPGQRPTVDGDPPLTSNPVVVRTATEARAVVDRAGRPWRGLHQGLRESVPRSVLRHHGSGATKGDSGGRPRSVPRAARGGRRRGPAHVRARAGHGAGLFHRGRSRAGGVREGPLRPEPSATGRTKPAGACSGTSAGSTRREIRQRARRRSRRIDETAWRRLLHWSGITTS